VKEYKEITTKIQALQRAIQIQHEQIKLMMKRIDRLRAGMIASK